MELNLLDRMLETYQRERTTVTVVLHNKIRVTGKIRAFDSYVIVMNDHNRDILYRHAVSSLFPHMQEAQHRRPESERPSPLKPPPPRSAGINPRQPAQKTVFKSAAHQPQAPSPSAGDPGLSNSMKDGLLKWMREHQAAK